VTEAVVDVAADGTTDRSLASAASEAVEEAVVVVAVAGTGIASAGSQSARSAVAKDLAQSGMKHFYWL
jgi:NAD/NADP transhydrogenase beta subunit